MFWMNAKRVVCAAVVSTVVLGASTAWAQDGSDATPQDAAPVAPEDAPKQKKPFENGLYVFAAYGMGDADELDIGIQTAVTRTSEGTFEIDEIKQGRFTVGWQLPDGGGDFRLEFTGYSEDSYEVEARGFAQALDAASVGASELVDTFLWNTVTIKDGVLTALQAAPIWDINTDDANGDGFAQREEIVQFGDPSVDIQQAFPEDLQNRVQTWDLTYGRTWGRPRITARWFAGARYLEYEGNIVQPLWLAEGSVADFGYTNAAFLPPLGFRQETTGFGPVGSLEAQINFANRTFQIYFQGEAAFLYADIETTSGTFQTFVREGDSLVSLPSSLEENRERSIWNTHGEIGFRVLLKNGLEFEAGIGITGFLDTVLLPPSLIIPETVQQGAQPASALFSTQDLVFETWLAGVGYQF